jgi:predicted dehydrogenase
MYRYTVSIISPGFSASLREFDQTGSTTKAEAPLCVYRDGESRIVEGIDQVDPFVNQWRYFVDCLERGRAIETATLEQGRTALKLALGSIESARGDMSVSLNECNARPLP